MMKYCTRVSFYLICNFARNEVEQGILLRRSRLRRDTTAGGSNCSMPSSASFPNKSSTTSGGGTFSRNVSACKQFTISSIYGGLYRSLRLAACFSTKSAASYLKPVSSSCGTLAFMAIYATMPRNRPSDAAFSALKTFSATLLDN
jgi:hypothetical protein